MSSPQTVLVTGATGFIGGHVCAGLREAGVHVRGLCRAGRRPPDGVEPAEVDDLSDRAGLRAALRGVDAVVHLAARAHVVRERVNDPLYEYRRVNVEGTRVLLEEAAAAGVSSFVYASSVKAVGESSGTSPWTEETEARPVDAYGISKLEAEEQVRAFSTAQGIAAPILRLPLVYGPGVRANMLSLLRLVDRGLPLPLGGVRNRRSLAYVGNVAAAVRAVLESPAAAAETFFVSDGHDLSTPELVREVARALGRPARLVPLPPAFFRVAGRVGDVVRRAVPFPVHSGVVDRLLGSLAIDSSKLERVAGFRPPFTVSQGMDRTADWYRAAASSR